MTYNIHDQEKEDEQHKEKQKAGGQTEGDNDNHNEGILRNIMIRINQNGKGEV